MLHRTEGIILHTTKYSENSLIVKMYTRDFGVQSYIINKGRGKTNKQTSALLQPISLVELIVSNTKKTGLNRISEIGLLQPYRDIPFNILKSSIVIFLNELLYKALKEEHADPDLFEFIKNSFLILDLKQESCSNFHIYFMIQLSVYLGFAPQQNMLDNTLFDLKEGRFSEKIPAHSLYINKTISPLFQALIQTDYEHLHLIKMDRQQRKELLQSLLLYYKLHLPSFGDIKSVGILEEITA